MWWYHLLRTLRYIAIICKYEKLVKRISYIVCMLCSCVAFSQTIDKKQEELYFQEFDKNAVVSMYKERYPKTTPQKSVSELFKDKFTQLKIIVFNYNLPTLHTGAISLLYAFDSKSFKRVFFENENTFLETINNSQKVTALDKCYLYIYLFYEREFTNRITKPYKYSKAVREFSEFSNAEYLFKDYFAIWNGFDQPKFENDVTNSTKNNIVVYVLHNIKKTFYTYRYNFVFNDNEDLIRVSIDTTGKL